VGQGGTQYQAVLVTPQQAWNIVCRMQAFERLVNLLVAVKGLRIGEVLALRWKHVDWVRFRSNVFSNFVLGRFGEPRSASSKKSAGGVAFALVMGLLKNWRETTAYAEAKDFIFASDRLKGKQPRVRNMLVEDHLPAGGETGDRDSARSQGFHNLRHALTSSLVEIGTDSKTIPDSCVGRTLFWDVVSDVAGQRGTRERSL